MLELCYIHYSKGEFSLKRVQDAFLRGHISWGEVTIHKAKILKLEVMNHFYLSAVVFEDKNFKVVRKVTV